MMHLLLSHFCWILRQTRHVAFSQLMPSHDDDDDVKDDDDGAVVVAVPVKVAEKGNFLLLIQTFFLQR
jgi:hypothetical protein